MKSPSLILVFLICIVAHLPGVTQNESKAVDLLTEPDEPMQLVQIRSDTIFHSMQSISLLFLRKRTQPQYQISFGFDRSSLKKTSSFAMDLKALAAINGGFFNMDDGGSVTYFEVDDSVINTTRSPTLKWGIDDSIRNGAILLYSDSIAIETVKSDSFYKTSSAESAALVTGPILLLHGAPTSLPDIKFSTNRHPRTCFCETRTSYVFIAIDGRQDDAAGMNLYEAQKFLTEIGCLNAINLDGGGSTTMWTKEKGIVNAPSDKSGERPVSNVLLIVEHDTESDNR